jgi:hypothetical protein
MVWHSFFLMKFLMLSEGTRSDRKRERQEDEEGIHGGTWEWWQKEKTAWGALLISRFHLARALLARLDNDDEKYWGEEEKKR